MRRRYVYRSNPGTGEVEAVEVSSDHERYAERQPVFTDRHMEGLRATDGADIGSRSKRREYMARNGLADAGDFTESWTRAKEKRAAFYEGREGHADVTDMAGRLAYQLRSKRR